MLNFAAPFSSASFASSDSLKLVGAGLSVFLPATMLAPLHDDVSVFRVHSFRVRIRDYEPPARRVVEAHYVCVSFLFKVYLQEADSIHKSPSRSVPVLRFDDVPSLTQEIQNFIFCGFFFSVHITR